MADPILQKIAEHLVETEDVVILPHINADGDALGAALALGLALTDMGKQVDILLEEEVPSNLDFLPGQELIKTNPREQYSTAVNIDNGDISRLGKRESYFWNAKTRLSIDHHTTNRVKAHYSYVNTKASATGEIVYDLLLNYFKGNLNKDISLCIYTAIVTDTGGFRYTNTTPETLMICADLMRHEIDFPYVIKKVFDMISYTKLYLMKKTINSLILLEDGKLAISYLTYGDIQNYDVKNDDFEGLVNIGRNLEGVEVSVFLREDSEGNFRGNLRSNNYVDVSEIAEIFNGGGHKRAAGFNSSDTREELIKKLIAVIVPKIRREA
ncbi:MAG: bifunctional oligoribonuclease/PAP phosphatase NrnA [Clostridiaceae bacterium]|nr:bifunctional oligoribonuclease/PAP phosphatase NrnA [Clostridiaceae bacterium]